MTAPSADPADLIAATETWWRTAITEVEPDHIRVRGYPIEQLIGRIGLGDMLWLLVRGELPSRPQVALLEAAMLGTVDHGPHAPSIAIARMAVTCGSGMNDAMAHGTGVLGDIHGGAIQQSMEMFEAFAADLPHPYAPEAVAERLRAYLKGRDAFLPGFGHRFHKHDPRTPRLLSIADKASKEGVIDGKLIDLARAVETALDAVKGKRIGMNIDGAAAAVYLELGFAPPLGRGLLVLSRSMGVMAHAWEQMRQGERIKGPVPKGMRYRYEGPAQRPVPGDDR
jgi:citrate synthase